MKCLLKYQWVKLPRIEIPVCKGIMGYWTKLASKAAFRKGQAVYCGHINQVDAGTWSGGVVGLKSILGVKSRAKALEIMDTLSYLGYIDYTIDQATKKLTYKINDYVVKCTGEPCIGMNNIYATDGYGFLCVPRNITERLACDGYTFEESDAWLDIWCHTVWDEPNNIFSYSAPVVQYGLNRSALTLETLGLRWGWEKTKVWRFLKKYRDTFTLLKLPGSFGCLIYNQKYPTGSDFTVPDLPECVHILDDIRAKARNNHFDGTDNERINKFIALYSHSLTKQGNSEVTNGNDCISEEKRIERQNMSVDIQNTNNSIQPDICGLCQFNRQYEDGLNTNILCDKRMVSLSMLFCCSRELIAPHVEQHTQPGIFDADIFNMCIETQKHISLQNVFLEEYSTG